MDERQRRALPARRVYNAWDDIATDPDFKLSTAFDQTHPGSDFEDSPTGEWFSPVLIVALLAGGAFFVNRWLTKRRRSTVSGRVSNPYLIGADVLSSS